MLGDRGAVLCVGISGVLAAGAGTIVWVRVSAAMPLLRTRCGMISTGKRPCYGHSPPPLFIRGRCCMAGYATTLPCRKTPKWERKSTGKGRCYTPPPLGGFLLCSGGLWRGWHKGHGPTPVLHLSHACLLPFFNSGVDATSDGHRLPPLLLRPLLRPLALLLRLPTRVTRI